MMYRIIYINIENVREAKITLSIFALIACPLNSENV